MIGPATQSRNDHVVCHLEIVIPDCCRE